MFAVFPVRNRGLTVPYQSPFVREIGERSVCPQFRFMYQDSLPQIAFEQEPGQEAEDAGHCNEQQESVFHSIRH